MKCYFSICLIMLLLNYSFLNRHKNCRLIVYVERNKVSTFEPWLVCQLYYPGPRVKQYVYNSLFQFWDHYLFYGLQDLKPSLPSTFLDMHLIISILGPLFILGLQDLKLSLPSNFSRFTTKDLLHCRKYYYTYL